jgi:hypothetical protein
MNITVTKKDYNHMNTETKATMTYINNAIDLAADIARAAELFDRNFKASESYEEGKRACERYLAEVEALYGHYVTKVETGHDRSRIAIDNFDYDWDGWASAYLGPDTSSGVYGAQEVDGKWFPAWIHPDGHDIDIAEESFDTPHAAIKRSHTFFS